MKKNILERVIRWTALVLVVLLTFPFAGATAIEPRASDYFESCQATVNAVGNGQIQVWFDVTADTNMDTLGALYIYIYESRDNVNWTYVETFSRTENPNMMLENDFYHFGCVTYQGVRGRYYKAYVCMWAGKDGDGENRFLWTSSRKAT